MKLSSVYLLKVNVALNNRAYFDGNLYFCENALKVLDIAGKMVLTP